MLLAEADNVYVACVELSILADYFGIEALILDISTYVRVNFQPVAEEVQRSFQSWANSVTVPVSAQFLDDYIEGAKAVFNNEAHVPALDPVRNAFVQFIANTNYVVLRDKSFLEALHEVPDLAAAILQNLFADGSPFLNLAKVELPYHCDTCKARTEVYASTTLVGGGISGFCLDCRKDE